MVDIPNKLGGEVLNGIHHLQLRVYYADTDFSGVVYHARYLEFFERGRTELLRACQIQHHQLYRVEKSKRLVWVVRRMTLDFLNPAYMDNILDLTTQIIKTSGARIKMLQTLRRDERKIATALVEVALIDHLGKPQRLPHGFHQQFLQLETAANSIKNL